MEKHEEIICILVGISLGLAETENKICIGICLAILGACLVFVFTKGKK